MCIYWKIKKKKKQKEIEEESKLIEQKWEEYGCWNIRKRNKKTNQKKYLIIEKDKKDKFICEKKIFSKLKKEKR